MQCRMWNHAIHTKAASQVNRFGLRHPRGLRDGERSTTEFAVAGFDDHEGHEEHEGWNSMTSRTA